jgi:competence protein ComEC
MMRGILIGDSAEMEKIWTDDFRRTGTFHTLVVSGLHVSVLAAFFVFLLRVCFVPKMPALAITTSLTWLYAVITGWHPPAIRAAAGLTLYLLARFVYRRGRVLNLLAAIAFVCLLLAPSQLFDASFQLTFLSVAAIGALATPLLEATSIPYAWALRDVVDAGRDPRLEPRQAALRVELRLIAETIHGYLPISLPWLIRALSFTLRLVLFAWDSVVISTVVQIGVALPMAVYFHRISLSGLSANIIVVPLLALAVPVGFAAVFTGAHFIAATARLLLVAAQHVAAWHVHLEPALRVPDPPLWLSISSVAALLALALAMRHSRIWRWPALAAVLALFAALLVYPFQPQVRSGVLELSAIDVGQGDSLFLAFPDGHLMLVDGGGFLTYGAKRQQTKIDTGEDVVSPYLWTREIRRLDVIVATHGHEDHTGGLPALMDNFHPAELWTGATPPGPVMDKLKAHARADGTRIVEHRAGDSMRFGGAEINVLSPAVDYVPDRDPGNNDSLVLEIVYGRRTFLLEGDAEAPAEERMLADGLVITADVLKVGHHGSKTSSTDPFLDAVQPKFAIISDGIDNLFHHPHRQTLERLEAHRARILRTDQLGLISIRTDGQRIWTENWAQDMQTEPIAAPPRFTVR